MNEAIRSYQKIQGGKDLGINGNSSMLNERSEDVWGPNYPRLRKIKVGLILYRYHARLITERIGKV